MSAGSRSPVRYVYPTISPQVVVIPIVSCIVVFPILVLIVICALRYRAMRARRFDKLTRGRRMGLAGGDHGGRAAAMEAYKDGRPFVQCRNGKRKTIVRFKPMPELDLDTVVEERSEFDAEVNALELLQAPQDPTKLCVLNHPVSFRSFRFGYGASGQPIKKSGSYGRPIGSPKPKRAKTVDEVLACGKGTLSSGGPQEEIFDSEPKPVLALQLLTTDVDGDPERSDLLSGNCLAEDLLPESIDTIEANSMTDEGQLDKGTFVIPSVSVQACADDSSDDSLSYIDKSEEVQFINECSNSAVVRMSTVGYQVKDPSEETNCLLTRERSNVDSENVTSNLFISKHTKCAAKHQLTFENFGNGQKTGKDYSSGTESSYYSKDNCVGVTTPTQPACVEGALNCNESNSEASYSKLESVRTTNNLSIKPQDTSIESDSKCASENISSGTETKLRVEYGENCYKNNFACKGTSENTFMKYVHTTLERGSEPATEPNTPSIFNNKWGRNPHKPTHLDDPLDYRQSILLMRSRSAADVIKSSSRKNACSFSLSFPSDENRKGRACGGKALGMPFKGSSLNGSFTTPKSASHSYDLDHAGNGAVKFAGQPKLSGKLEEFRDSFSFRVSASGCSVEECIEADDPSDGAEV